MKSKEIEFRKDEQCICETGPCRCEILVKEIEEKSNGFNQKNL